MVSIVGGSNLPDVVADRDKLTQVFRNLIENAIKYSPDGGTVTLAFTHDLETKRVIASVTDEGIGIAPEDLEKLFRAFNRGFQAEAEFIRGTELGLYIVKSLVEAMAGEVWARSTRHVGSMFSFSLPCAEAA